jgi:phosphocarrier protein HPr
LAKRKLPGLSDRKSSNIKQYKVTYDRSIPGLSQSQKSKFLFTIGIDLLLSMDTQHTKGFLIMEKCMVDKPKNNKKVTGVFTIKNDRGLHTRPSTEIVKCASQFKSEIQLKYKKTTVNARSLLGILMLAAEKGSKIRITASGGDAQEAVDALIELAAVSFHMKY